MESMLSDMYRLCGNLLVSLENETLATPIMGMADFSHIKATLENFRQRFGEGEHVDWGVDAVKRCYKALEDPLARLDEFFQHVQGQEFDIEERKQVYYVASHLEKEIEQLRDVARQIDEGTA